MLARDNARRNPQRTASTAAALMIGLALVTLVAVLAAGITSSVPRRGEQASGRTPTTRSPRRTTSLRSRSLRPTRSQRSPASRRSATSAPATRTRSARASSQRRSTPPVRRCSSSTGSRARTDARDARRRRRVRRQGLREEASPAGRIAVPPDLLERAKARRFTLRGIFDPPDRRVAVRERDHLAEHLGSLQREPAEPLLVRPHEGRSSPTRTSGADQQPRRRSRTRRRRRVSSSSTTRSAGSTRCSTSSTCCSRSR